MFALMIILYLLVLSLYKERDMLGCKDKSIISVITSTPKCDNENNQISTFIRDKRPDDFFKAYERIVYWRRSYILSFLIVCITYLTQGIPFNGNYSKMLISILCGTFFIYFSFNFYKYHLMSYMEEDIKKYYTCNKKDYNIGK